MHDDLLTRITAYRERNGIAEQTFGWKCCKNYRLVERIRAGADMTTRTRRRVEEFLEADEAKHEAAE